MKHHNYNATRSSSRNSARRDRRNPSRHERVPIGEWEAEVATRKQGRFNNTLRRKVATRGIKHISVGRLLGEVARYLRRGYEVRLVDGKQKSAVRFYPCLDKEYKAMFVSAQTMGDFRHSINDIKFRVSNKGKELDVEQSVEDYERKREQTSRTLACVTPDMTVECPQCGFEFRIGKVLSSKKEG